MPASAEHICVVIGRTRHKMVMAEMQEAVKHGARMVELRLDFLAKAADFKRLLATKQCAVVATARRPQDGGRWSGTEEERLMLLRQCIVSGFEWVDLETDVADSIRRFKDVRRIVSYHNMREVPADLEKIHQKMCKQDADVVKIAVRAQQPADNLRVMDLLKDPPRATIAYCMGDMGLPSRILGARLGAPFTYGAFNKERGIAPGLPSFDELCRIYHYEQIDGDTQVYGVVGDPVAHSLSPLVMNTAFRHLGINAVYVPFRVPRGSFPAFVQDFDRLPVRGYSVTIPHKEAAADLAKQQDPLVMHTQAANTLIRAGDLFLQQSITTGPPQIASVAPRGETLRFTAYNTDCQAAVDSLLANLPPSLEGAPPTLTGRIVLILGAGGVARAVAHALHREGAGVTLANRTADRSQQLAQEVGCRAVDWAARHSVVCDLLVNCTSVGMHPHVDESPIHPSFLKPGITVFDTVYTPETTLLIKEARARGCHTVTGVDMFIRQAALQFRLFTGREAPFELLRSTVRKALSPVAIREPEDE